MINPGVSSRAVPYTLNDGLAMYSVGEGKAVLLMPYPHGFSAYPVAEGKLAKSLVDAGYRIITFDPPGTFHSTRLAQITMSEMLSCAEETLQTMGIRSLYCIIGHSMGGLCAIGYVLAHPGCIQKLVLIGTVSGGPAIARCKGMPWGMRRTNLDFWRFIFWGWQLSAARGNLALHKKFLRLLWKHSYADRRFVPVVDILPEDKRLPAPIRDKWPMVARHLDYRPQLKEIRVPTLVCVGRFDPQAPLSCSEELAQSIPGANLVVFERSGHYPFIEEQQHFAKILSGFLAS